MTSYHAMPLIVSNLGVEMIYVLNQRLGAQNVAKEKRWQLVVNKFFVCIASSCCCYFFHNTPMMHSIQRTMRKVRIPKCHLIKILYRGVLLFCFSERGGA